MAKASYGMLSTKAEPRPIGPSSDETPQPSSFTSADSHYSIAPRVPKIVGSSNPPAGLGSSPPRQPSPCQCAPWIKKPHHLATPSGGVKPWELVTGAQPTPPVTELAGPPLALRLTESGVFPPSPRPLHHRRPGTMRHNSTWRHCSCVCGSGDHLP